MAKQRGIVKLEGTIGDITFLKTQDGYLAKEKTSIPASRIANDPAFQRTRENGAEFGRAGKAGKVLRNAFRLQIQQAKDRRMVSRLTKLMVQVVQADAVNPRGLRNVIDGEATLLQGFEFNGHSTLGSSLQTEFTGSIDRATGLLKVELPSFIPNSMIVAPKGTTHFKIKSAGGSVDFEKGEFFVQASETGYLPWDAVATAPITLENELTANSTHPLFLLLGIEYTQEVNGIHYSLKNGSFNSMAIVMVDA